jgi:peptidylprolyl isomerase
MSMKRILLAACVVALTTLAGCGSGAAPATPATPATSAPATPAATSAPATTAGAAPAPAAPGTTVPGIPALSGTPTDLTAQSQAKAGTGTPPAVLLTQDVVVGTGPAAKASDTVNVRYSGTLYDGTPFDSSWSDGSDPVSFPLSQVVPGFSEGIAGMQAGGRRVIVIPPQLGYGAEGSGPVPGNATLVFVTDLVSIG